VPSVLTATPLGSISPVVTTAVILSAAQQSSSKQQHDKGGNKKYNIVLAAVRQTKKIRRYNTKNEKEFYSSPKNLSQGPRCFIILKCSFLLVDTKTNGKLLLVLSSSSWSEI
jgi:hypothetical protein